MLFHDRAGESQSRCRLGSRRSRGGRGCPAVPGRGGCRRSRGGAVAGGPGAGRLPAVLGREVLADEVVEELVGGASDSLRSLAARSCLPSLS